MNQNNQNQGGQQNQRAAKVVSKADRAATESRSADTEARTRRQQGGQQQGGQQNQNK